MAERGAAQKDLEPRFAALDADPPGALDGVRDTANMPLADESACVREDLAAFAAR